MYKEQVWDEGDEETVSGAGIAWHMPLKSSAWYPVLWHPGEHSVKQLF